MKYVLDAAMSKEVDRYTIENAGVPSAVLMERAALAVAEKTAGLAVRFGSSVKVCAVCGCGNNGADGIAAARILTWQGLRVDIIIVGNRDKASEEFLLQEKIAVNSRMTFNDISEIPAYNIIIDAVFGTGLSREVTGEYCDVINRINASGALVVSVDIPSGVDSTTGAVLGNAVSANETVTFGYNKQGLMFYPGREIAGNITVADIGFCPEAIRKLNPAMYFTRDDIKKIPVRLPYSNKGTYGRTLVVAGSPGMSGAAYMAAAAAYRSGAGLVEIFTEKSNCQILGTLLPEAIVTGYAGEDAAELLKKSMERADFIIIGPGLSQSSQAECLVAEVMKRAEVPIIADADALNIMSKSDSLLKNHKSDVIITPHVGEMARLSGFDRNHIKGQLMETAVSVAGEYNVICVLKDAVTVVAEPGGRQRRYINNSGCAAMSKGGMGDVLTGVIAGMLSVGIEPFSAAAMGVYVHGLAGQEAASGHNSHGVTATDVIEKLPIATETEQ